MARVTKTLAARRQHVADYRNSMHSLNHIIDHTFNVTLSSLSVSEDAKLLKHLAAKYSSVFKHFSVFHHHCEIHYTSFDKILASILHPLSAGDKRQQVSFLLVVLTSFVKRFVLAYTRTARRAIRMCASSAKKREGNDGSVVLEV